MESGPMSWDENNFEDRIANLEAVWAKRNNPITKNEKRLKRLELECEFACRDAGLSLATLENIPHYVRQWLATKNPYYMDAAMGCTFDLRINPPATLLEFNNEVTLARLEGRERGGTAKKVRDEATLSWALAFVGNLHLSGANLATAASKVARYLSDSEHKTFRASYLESMYSKMFRTGSPSIEELMLEARERESSQQRDEWLQILSSLPEADDDLLGSRR